MRKAGTLTVLIALVPAFSAAHGGALKKAYFAKTRPGAWATYRMVDEKGVSTRMTYERLPDEGGRARIDVLLEFTSGPHKGVWTRNSYVLKPGFPVERNALSCAGHAVKVTIEAMGRAPVEVPVAKLRNLAAGMTDYDRVAVFRGTESVAGRECDRYTYVHTLSPPGKDTLSGEVWLSETVPFGMVKEITQVKDAAGKLKGRTETVLVDSGVKTLPAPKR